jgi:hypothetical protein
VPATGLAPAVAHLPRSAAAATAVPRVPAARPGPVAGFLRATGFGGSKVAAGWNPKAWNPKAWNPKARDPRAQHPKAQHSRAARR